MNRKEIMLLAALRGYPSLTITLPTHRTSPDNRQDPIRLKNLAREAAERLTGELGKREVEGVLRALEQLADGVDHEHNRDGLALFVSADTARALRLPYSLPERVVVDESFFTRDLVYANNRSPRYWVLALSDQQTRLFEGVREDLEELRDGTPFPMANSGVGGGRTIPNDPAINSSQLRDEHSRIYFRAVDEALGGLYADDPLPLVVVGVDRNLAFYQEVAASDRQIVGTLQGNHDRSSAHELGQLVWPLVYQGLAARRAQIMDELGVAVGGQRSASTLGEVWRFAQEGRGQTLLVEEGYHEAATFDETGMRLLPPGDGQGPQALDDAVDEAVATVLAKGGRIVFVDDGSLAEHSRIALILRY